MKFIKQKLSVVFISLVVGVALLPLSQSLPKTAQALQQCYPVILDIKITDLTTNTVVGTYRDLGHIYDPLTQTYSEADPSYYEVTLTEGHLYSYQMIGTLSLAATFYYYTTYNVYNSQNPYLFNASTNPNMSPPAPDPWPGETFRPPALNIEPDSGAIYEGILDLGNCSWDADHNGFSIANVTISIASQSTASSFTCSVDQSTATVDPGGEASYTINSAGQNGFNSPVTFTGSTTPAVADSPTISFTNNGQLPPGPTFARVRTSASTPGQTYGVTFIGTASTGETATCGTQLIVNPAEGGFDLEIAPHGTSSNPVKSLIGNDVEFDVFAYCYGGFTGPINRLEARTAFTNVDITTGSNRLDCGESTVVTIRNTGAVPSAQQSTYPDPADFNPEDVIVSGQGEF